jgi:branched-chain amino acid transport system substrate-binding protein
MKKMKKVLSLALVLSMTVAGFSGCGTKESGSDAAKNASKDAAFHIGGIGPLTEAAAVYGLAVKNGAQLAVDEINKAGGINGKKIDFNFEDDVNDPEKAVNAYNTLKDKGMQILMGTVTSTPCVSVAEKTAKDNMFQLTPSGSSPSCITNDNAFQVCFSDPNQGVASAKYIGENKIASKVAVIYDGSDVYSSGIYEKFAQEAKKQNFKIVAAESFTADSKSDFSVQIQKAKDSGAQLLFLPIYYTEATLILTQAASLEYDPIFFGCDGLDGILGVKNFKKELAEGVMLLTPFAADAKDVATQKFVTAYKNAYNKDTPNQFAADAYDAIYVIKAAIEKGKVTPDMSISDMGDALKKAMTEIQVNGLTGQGMTWMATGEVNKSPRAVVIKNGKYVLAQQ